MLEFLCRNFAARIVQKRIVLTLQTSLSRNLSYNEVAIALRPFYFKVHPDLFGLYPQQRAVNDESLKLLSEHMSRLQQQQERTKPLSLLFYIKQPDLTQSTEDTTGPIKSVRVSLLSDSTRGTVCSILKACDLPLDYVNSIPILHEAFNSNRGIDSTTKVVPSFYSFYGFRKPDLQDEEAHLRRPKENPIDSMRKWLDKNSERARQKVAALEPIREETEKLKKLLVKEVGLVDVRWECGWSLTQFRACLCGFIQLYKTHKTEVCQLKGYSLVFANQNGLCVRGDIVLRKDDVPNHWLPVLLSLHKHEVILNKLPSRENHLSSLLGGIQIVRQGGNTIVMAEAYHTQLRRVISTVKGYLQENPEIVIPDPLDDLELVVGSATGPMTISPSGKIIVPSSSPGFLIVKFLSKNYMNARRVKSDYLLKESVNTEFINICVEKLRLKELTRDSNVTLMQMESCCDELVSCYESGDFDVDLHGCILKIASFYSVMSDGEMHIPWNWNKLNI